LTQEQLAVAIRIRQPTLSRLESRDDMQVSTLQRLVRPLGPDLGDHRPLPTGDIRLS
jgi:hypothetical protein